VLIVEEGQDGGDVTRPVEIQPKYIRRESEQGDAKVFDKGTGLIKSERVIRWGDKLQSKPLPLSSERFEGHSVVGRAAQAFNQKRRHDGVNVFPGWISGQLDLPPGAIKDPEAVNDCTQVFYVVSGPSEQFELAIAEPSADFEERCQRFILSPGDHFFVPPNNMYRLENHSEKGEVRLFFSILRPAPTGTE
jgi:hypothetical protein